MCPKHPYSSSVNSKAIFSPRRSRDVLGTCEKIEAVTARQDLQASTRRERERPAGREREREREAEARRPRFRSRHVTPKSIRADTLNPSICEKIEAAYSYNNPVL